MRYTIYRTTIMVVAILLMLHFAMPYMLSYAREESSLSPLLEDNYKFGDKVEKTALEGFIYHIKMSKGYKVVFIGDSVVAGATVKNRGNTIPANFERLAAEAFPGEDIKVYNLGMPGNRYSDIYFTFKKLCESKAFDLIITNVNYAFFSDEMLNDKSIARPDLYRDVMEKESVHKLGLDYSFIEDGIRNDLINKWNIYGLREEMSFFLFGRNPREILTGIRPAKKDKENNNDPLFLQQFDGKDDPKTNWRQNAPFPEEQVEHWVQVFNIGKLDDQNRGYWFLEKFAEDVQKDKINAAAFFTPINAGMVEEFNLMKYGQNFDSNMETMRNVLDKSLMPVFDYTNSIDTEKFHDLFHMGVVGNKDLAKLLFNDLKNVIEKGLN